jgi:protein dithiol oxidoreductase (disulfide-forming)
MQRRLFTQALANSAMTAPLLWPHMAQAQAAMREGSDYRRLSKPAPVEAAAGKVEVVEFFSYTCVHCYNFVPVFDHWKKSVGTDVVIKRNPVGFNASFEPLQRLYYTLEALGKIDSHHARVFKAIHEERQRLNTLDAMAQWAERNGIDRTQFVQTFNSFGVAGKARRATQLQDAYEVEGTPSLGIAGRFYVPGQAARTVQIANALIQQARQST